MRASRNVSFRLRRSCLGLLFVLPTACGLFLEDYRLDDSRLRNAICQFEQLRCVGGWLMQCGPRLDGWVDLEACGSPERCDSAHGVCTACKSGEHRCNGTSLEVCNAARNGWDLVEKCRDGVACNLNLEVCAPCTPDEYQCNQGALSKCDAQGNWGPPTQCAAPGLCSVAADRKSGSCAAPANCTPNKYACQDARLVRCDPDGAGWTPIETCASAALCTDSVANAADSVLVRCVAPVCGAQQATCEGNQLKTCSDDRKSWVSSSVCSGDVPCNPKLRGCGRCTPGENFCSGPELFTCDDKGAFQHSATCASEALCDASTGACIEPNCDERTPTTCSSSDPLLYRCTTERKVQELACETTALCNPREERCEVAACAPSAVRCDGARLQTCNTDQTGWKTETECQSAKLCDVTARGCSSAACTKDTFRCNDIFLERCGADGYQRVARCANAALCDAKTGTCMPPMCAPGKFHCLGNSIQRCGPELRWIDVWTCSGQCDEINGKCL